MSDRPRLTDTDRKILREAIEIAKTPASRGFHITDPVAFDRTLIKSATVLLSCGLGGALGITIGYLIGVNV